MKTVFLGRLKIAGFILALVGWLMLITVPLELVGKDLSSLETLFETNTFTWGLRISVLVLVIALIKGQKTVDFLFTKYTWLHKLVQLIVAGGIIGWLLGLGSLLL